MHAILIFFLLLPKLLVHCSSSVGQVMKRESGGNPEQTRCCEFLFLFQETRCHCPDTGWEGFLKRNESEDLPVTASF